ncbi:MAG: hypothetical protein HN509_06325 [Halobacteriovoraceae bacterium]|nr:hypothetical protein [Halobacteriovoraceae bacterium]
MQQIDSKTKLYDRLFYAVLAIGFLIVLSTYKDYGITWDQAAQYDYGVAVYNYYLTFFNDKTALTLGPNLYLYGGFVDFWSTVGTKLLTFMDPFEWRALYTALWGLLGWFFFFRWAKLLTDSKIAFYCLLVLILTPTYWGHSFINSKDMPFAVAFLASFYFLNKNLLSNNPSLKDWLYWGAATGVLLSIRIGGALVVFYSLLFILYNFKIQRKQKLSSFNWKAYFSALLLAYVIMLIFWPWAQQSPLVHPIEALLKISRFNWSGKVLFMGSMVAGKEVPFYYLPVYFGVKLPIIYHLGVFSFCYLLFKKIKFPDNFKSSTSYLLFAVLFPLIFVILSGSTIYDGIRHFIFLIPFLCLIAGVSIYLIAHTCSKIKFAKLSYLIWAVVLLLPLPAMIHLHPNQYVYYNELFGSLPAAKGNFELDYWGNSFKETVTLLNKKVEHYENNGEPFKVAVCGHPISTVRFFSKRLKWHGNINGARFYIVYSRNLNCPKFKGKRRVIQNIRQGVVLSEVYDLREI